MAPASVNQQVSWWQNGGARATVGQQGVRWEEELNAEQRRMRMCLNPCDLCDHPLLHVTMVSFGE